MKRVTRFAAFAAALGMAVAVTSQDAIKYFHPEKYERATTTDEAGMVQWAEHKGEKCQTCSGTGKAKCTTCVRLNEEGKCPECQRNEKREVDCRACAGTGAMPDPLEKALCPACMAAGFLLCSTCSGNGQMKVNGAKQWSKCPSCRAEGGFKCGVCDGKRLVEVAGLKPSLAEADSKALKKALLVVESTLTALAAYKPVGGTKVRKDVKALAQVFEDAQSVFPALKRTPKVLNDYMGKVFAGSQFQGHEQSEADSLMLVRANAEYFMKHQKRMMDLCLKRAEANEKLAAENKGK